MIEMIEKSMLTAVGAITLTQKKAEEMLRELREKCNISEEEGKVFLQKLQEAATQNQEMLQEQARIEVKKACERMGVVTAEEFEKLKKKGGSARNENEVEISLPTELSDNYAAYFPRQ